MHFKIPSSPTPKPPDIFSSTFQSTTPPPLQPSSQQNTPKILSDYLGSTPTSKQIPENPYNPPTSSQHLPHWMTQAFTQGEPVLVNETIKILSETFLSLHETLSLPSTPSIIRISTTSFPPKFATNLKDRYKKHLTNNTPLRLD